MGMKFSHPSWTPSPRWAKRMGTHEFAEPPHHRTPLSDGGLCGRDDAWVALEISRGRGLDAHPELELGFYRGLPALHRRVRHRLFRWRDRPEIQSRDGFRKAHGPCRGQSA